MQTVYVDNALLVLDKPADLLSVPGRGADKQDCLATRAQQWWPDALVVHRLDMATSGLLLMARNKEVQRMLGDAFAQRRIVKRYLAVVQGELDAPAQGWGDIDLPLLLDWPNRPRSRVNPERGKPSRTRWRVLPGDERWRVFATEGDLTARTTRVELEPLTGRSHQLRVHLQALGHPILGDALYADADATPACSRLLLHAWRLELTHPVTANLMQFESPVPF